MGNCCCCGGGDPGNGDRSIDRSGHQLGHGEGGQATDPADSRRRALEAAERREAANAARGMKDPEGYKRKVAQREKIEKEAAERGADQGGGLKWQVG